MTELRYVQSEALLNYLNTHGKLRAGEIKFFSYKQEVCDYFKHKLGITGKVLTVTLTLEDLKTVKIELALRTQSAHTSYNPLKGLSGAGMREYHRKSNRLYDPF